MPSKPTTKGSDRKPARTATAAGRSKLSEESRQDVLSAARTAVQETLSTMISLDSNEEQGRPTLKAHTLTAVSRVTGGWDGLVEVQCERPLARVLGAALFGKQPEELPDEELQDALDEVTNMIVGNLKAVLPGSCAHSRPEVEEFQNIHSETAASVRTDQVFVSTEQGRLRVNLVEGGKIVSRKT